MLYQAPSPQQQKKQKDPPQRETNKLRLFLKRSSEPLLNLQNAAQQVKKIEWNWQIEKKSIECRVETRETGNWEELYEHETEITFYAFPSSCELSPPLVMIESLWSNCDKQTQT